MVINYLRYWYQYLMQIHKKINSCIVNSLSRKIDILLGDHNQLDTNVNVSCELIKEHMQISSSLYLKLLRKGIQHRILKT